MGDTFREVTRTSWFGRIGRSVGGMLLGLILVLAMPVGLFWNEGRAVTTARSLAEGAGLVASVTADRLDPANQDRLVHVSGVVTATAEPVDAAFGVRARGVRIERHVEMYQWVERSSSETRTTLGGGQETVTTYTYAREWSSRPVDSADFRKPQGHANPAMSYRSADFQIASAGLGAFTLDGTVLSRIGGGEPLPIGADLAAAIRAAYAGTQRLSFAGDRAYLGRDAASPQVGDHRISWQLVPLGPVSIVARQSGASFAPYQTVAGDRLLMVAEGAVPPEAMFADAVSDNAILTWVLRGVGLLLLTIGFALLMGPIGIIADVIPFLGSLVRIGAGAVAFVLAILVGGATIAVAWFWYRPLLAAGIILGAFAIAWLISRLGARRSPAATPLPP